jgi:hypothetical protein
MASSTPQPPEGGQDFDSQQEMIDLDLAPENLLDLLDQPVPPTLTLRNGTELAPTAEELRADAHEWVGPRTKVIREDKVRDPHKKQLTIWQLLRPVHKTLKLSMLRRRAAEAGVGAEALRTAEGKACPHEGILALHIAWLAGDGSPSSPRTRSELQHLRLDLAAVKLKARTDGHFLLVCATSAPAPGITIQRLEGLAQSVAAFQSQVARGIARQLERAQPDQCQDTDDGTGSRLGTPRGAGAGAGAGAQLGSLAGLPAQVGAPVATIAQRIVDLDVAIESAKDAINQDALRRQRDVLETRLVELTADRPACQAAAEQQVPWARGLDEPPKERKDLGPRAGGAVLVYDQEQQVRLGVTEMGDPVPGEPRDGCSAAKRMFDKHAVSMTRIRQLAEPEPLAMALNGVRFNNGGLEAEREEARGWLHQWARIGWDVTAAVELMWQGERQPSKLSDACAERLARPLLRLILNADIGEVRRHPLSDAASPEGGAANEQLAPTAAAAYAMRKGDIAKSALHSPSAFIPTPPASRRSHKPGGHGSAADKQPNVAADGSRRAWRSKDLRDRITDDLWRLQGSKAATEALFAAEDTINAARSKAPMLTAEEIRRNIRRPELRLAQAVARRDQAAVVQLLESGAKLEACDPLQPGWTPLHEAAQRGDLEILRILINHGASPDAVDDLTGTTPFLWACYSGHAECVKDMLQDGTPTPSSQQMNWSIAGPNAHRHLTKDDVGRTGLQIARLNRHHEVVDVLLMHEAQLKTEAKRKRWYYMSRQQQETLAEDYGVQGPPQS